MEERPDAQKQILVEIAKKLPIFTRAQSGGIVEKKSVYYTYRVYILILLRLSREPRDVWEGKDNMIGVFQLEPPSRTISQWISFISADCSDQV